MAGNVRDILILFGFSPKMYIHRREKYGWKDLHMISLNRGESKKVEALLDRVLNSLGCNRSFYELKYEPAGI